MQYTLTLLLVFLLLGCTSAPVTNDTTNTTTGLNDTTNTTTGLETCDAEKACASGTCALLPGETQAKCYSDPCSELECPEGTCVQMESYPVQVKCNPIEKVKKNTTNETVSANAVPEGKKAVEPIGDIIAEFSSSDISSLGLSCSGTNEEIADCIYDWQVNNMLYCAGISNITGCSDALRWNWMIGGLMDSKDMIERTYGEKPYGFCLDYAAIYCSIAQYYGLDCRIRSSISKPSENDPSYTGPTTGMSKSEYVRMRDVLFEKGLNFTYEEINQAAEETPEHYWAEVYLGNQWVIKDASNQATGGDTYTEYVSKGDVQLAVFNRTTLVDKGGDYYYDYVPDQESEGPPAEKSLFQQVLDGEAQAPEYTDCNDICEFLGDGSPAPWCMPACTEDESFYSCYNSCAEEDLNIICYFMCEDVDTEIMDMDCYTTCSGNTLNTDCDNSC